MKNEVETFEVKTFEFHFRDGHYVRLRGYVVSDALLRNGYTKKDMQQIDYYREIKDEKENDTLKI